MSTLIEKYLSGEKVDIGDITIPPELTEQTFISKLNSFEKLTEKISSFCNDFNLDLNINSTFKGLYVLIKKNEKSLWSATVTATLFPKEKIMKISVITHSN